MRVMDLVDRSFPIVVIGAVSARFSRARVSSDLSPSKQRLLGALVAAGTAGIHWEALIDTRGKSVTAASSAVRMSMSRLRDHLPEGSIESAVDGRYCLALPPASVDAWRLFELSEAKCLPDELDRAELQHLLRPDEPYAKLGGTPATDSSGREIRQAQRDLFERLGLERPADVTGRLAEHLSEHVRLDPFNDRLLELAASGMARSGNRRGALQLISLSRVDMARAGMTLSFPVVELEAALLDGRVPDLVRVPRSEPALENLPVQMTQHLERTYHGPTVDLERLTSMLGAAERRISTALVSGPSGVGKSRLCAELARRALKRSFSVLCVAPVGSKEDAALGPFLAAVPELRVTARAIFGRDLDSESRKAELWLAALNAIVDDVGHQPRLVIIDDSQWLDSMSVEFLLHLATSAIGTSVVLVVVGREDRSDANNQWLMIVDALRRSGAAEMEVAPLPEDAIAELVRERRPSLDEPQVLIVAREVLAATGGLPGVAALVIDRLDETLMSLPSSEELAQSRPLDSIVRRLSVRAREIGGAGAVLGLEFDLSDVTKLTRCADAEAVRGLEELVNAGLVVERGATQFAFCHVLAQAGLLAAHLASRVASWHLVASNHFVADAHLSARHLALAAPLADPEQTIAALRRSASIYLDAGLYREAVATYTTASNLNGGRLGPTDAGRLSRALDLSGSRSNATDIRQHAFEMALAVGEYSSALDIATSGLPEAEPIDGDETIVANLLRIDRASLDRSGQWRLARHLTRQLTIVGRLEAASQNATVAASLSETEDELVGAAVGRRFVISTTSTPSDRLAALNVPAGRFAAARPALQAEFMMLRALDEYELGDRASAIKTRRRLDNIELPAVRRWHTMLFDAMVLTDDGDTEGAVAARHEALGYARRSGLRESENASLVAEFTDRWLRHQAAAFLGLVETRVLDPDHSVLSRAGAAVILFEAGQVQRGIGYAEQVAEAVLQSPVTQGTAALAIVSSVLVRSNHHALIRSARAILSLRGDSMIVVGAGAACLGPAARYVAALTKDSAKRHALLRSAIGLADRADSPLWRIVTRLDLLQTHDSGSVAEETRKLIAASSLTDLDPEQT